MIKSLRGAAIAVRVRRPSATLARVAVNATLPTAVNAILALLDPNALNVCFY
jgi:hypothetical protein